jgi:hypothetical protein
VGCDDWDDLDPNDDESTAERIKEETPMQTQKLQPNPAALLRKMKPMTDIGNLGYDDLLPAFVNEVTHFDGSIVKCTGDVIRQQAFRAEVQRIMAERDVQAVANYLGRYDIERIQGRRGWIVDAGEFADSGGGMSRLRG